MNKYLENNNIEKAFFGILCFYIFSYNPFIFEAYIWSSVRISFEILVLAYLFINLNFKERNFLLLIAILTIYGIYWGENIVGEMGGGATKLIFLIFISNYFLRSKYFLYFCADKIIIISCIASLMAITAFFGYFFKVIPFSPYDITFETIGEIGNYQFMHNFWVGNILPRELFGILFGRSTWWMFEGQFLGAFFAISILGLKNFIESDRWRIGYEILMFLAGLSTLSTSFFIFFAFYYFIISIEKIFKREFQFEGILLIFIIGLIFFMSFFFEFLERKTSYIPRFNGAIEYMDVLQNASIFDLMFGFGKISINNVYPFGIDFGWALVFMQFGTLLSSFLIITLLKLTRNNKFFMMYVFFINTTFNAITSPFFLTLIALVGIKGINNFTSDSEGLYRAKWAERQHV